MKFDFNDTLLFFIGLILFFFFLNKRAFIANYLKIIDKPDKKRKIHKQETPLTGSLSIFIFFSLICIINIIRGNFGNELNIIFISTFLIFIIGIYDDRKNLGPYLKLFLISVIFLVSLKLNESFILKEIFFSSLDKKYSLPDNTDIAFTVLCLLLLINALNLVDGINSLANMIVTIWLSYLILFYNTYLSNIFFWLFILILLNNFFIYKGKYFIGNSGSLFYSSLVGMLSIYNYNVMILNSETANVEEIFILFMIPGFDMFRLFIERILKKKHPFKGDNNHLHHFLIKIFPLKKCLLIYFFIITLPILLNYFFKINEIYIIIFSLIFYIILLIALKIYLSKKNSNKKVT